MSIQPFRGDQVVIIEKRKEDGSLDFTPPQPPVGGMKFDRVYDLYFRETRQGNSATWDQLAAWLKSKGWVLRAKTW